MAEKRERLASTTIESIIAYFQTNGDLRQDSSGVRDLHVGPGARQSPHRRPGNPVAWAHVESDNLGVGSDPVLFLTLPHSAHKVRAIKTSSKVPRIRATNSKQIVRISIFNRQWDVCVAY